MLGTFVFILLLCAAGFAACRTGRHDRGARILGGACMGACVWMTAMIGVFTLSTLFDPQDGCAADICGTWSPVGFVGLFVGWLLIPLGAAIGLDKPRGDDCGSGRWLSD